MRCELVTYGEVHITVLTTWLEFVLTFDLWLIQEEGGEKVRTRPLGSVCSYRSMTGKVGALDMELGLDIDLYISICRLESC